ncbi:homeodomain mating type protein alpha2 [Colletotrichum tropicale]|nr:homeodomain mating type protein alpha2 [Colletotrichum tropicale]
MPSTQDKFQAVGLDFDQLGMFSDLISGQSNSAVDFQHQIDSGMASPSSSISGGVPLSAEVEDNAAIPPGPAEAAGEPEATVPSKIGSRFTSGAIKVLRTWFERHEKHPYPTPKDVDRLQNQTGLERQQITNWFANTRRRKKFRSQGTSTAQVPSWTETTTGPIEIPTRRPTPMPFEMMNPMQRWEHSPPEHEPALASDINRAVAASTGQSKRADHLADHFKNGSTMTDWQGDWGFEPAVTEILDNAMPPYLIRFESFSALPFTASVGPADTAPSAYELLKLEIEYYIRNYFEGKDSSPSDDELKYEGCSIIFGAEFFSTALGSSPPSWLRDIFMCSTEIATKARFRPMQQLAKLRLSQLRINGKMNIFEECQLESELRHYIGMHVTLGLALSDHEIQREACAILARVEESSTNPSRRFAGFLVRLIWESKDWITPLRQRGKQHSQDGLSTQPAPGLHGDWSEPALDIAQRNLPEFSPYQGAGRMAPAADSSWLSQTASMDGLQDPIGLGLESTAESTQDFYMRLQAAKTIFKGSGQSLQGSWQGNERPGGSGMPFFLNDNNRYRRLAKELSRFVASTMSPNNPNSHIPTDEEIRHQARWVLYDE